MQFEAHPDCRSHHLLQQVQIREHPLVFGCDAEVPFKQGVETVQKRFQALRRRAVVCGEKMRKERKKDLNEVHG